MSEIPPSDEEKRAAEALAQALESKDPDSGPADAELATAMLLRHAKASDASPLPEPVPLRRPRRHFATGIGIAVAASVALLLLARPRATPLPPASRALLEAQSRAHGEGLAPLDGEMQRYRVAMLDRLSQRYGARAP